MTWSFKFMNTNIAEEFLNLLDKPPPHFAQCYEQNCIKVSYRCLPNMDSVVVNHNAKIMNNCNCQTSKKPVCPMPGKCNQDGVVYQATISSDGGRSANYVGLAKNFKKRWRKHKSTLNDKNAEGGSTMSTYFHEEKDGARNPEIKLKYLETNIQTFKYVPKDCRLCLRENVT